MKVGPAVLPFLCLLRCTRVTQEKHLGHPEKLFSPSIYLLPLISYFLMIILYEDSWVSNPLGSLIQSLFYYIYGILEVLFRQIFYII